MRCFRGSRKTASLHGSPGQREIHCTRTWKEHAGSAERIGNNLPTKCTVDARVEVFLRLWTRFAEAREFKSMVRHLKLRDGEENCCRAHEIGGKFAHALIHAPHQNTKARRYWNNIGTEKMNWKTFAGKQTHSKNDVRYVRSSLSISPHLLRNSIKEEI